MTALDDFIAEARALPLDVAFSRVKGELGVKRLHKGQEEFVGRCPACGGRDRFSINFGANVWFCRQYDGKGGDGLQLIAHAEGLDLKRRAHLLAACAILNERPVPEEGERESEQERSERLARIAGQKAEAERKREKADRDGADFRTKEINRARGIYLAAGDGAGSAAEDYLRRRTGAQVLPEGIWENLRFSPGLTYWHGQDERGHMRDIHCGPALVAPMVDPVGEAGRITGCHQTWIDLGRGQKYRPALLDDKGEPLPTKKMRGHKKGSVIPVLGDLDRARWVVGEGIETVLAVALFEHWRDDTFYAAAGDIGNIAGPADPKSAFNHPTSRKQDSKGRWKPVRVAGPVPKADSPGEAFGLPDHVRLLVVLADGDSEFVATASAMARAEARLGREGLEIATWWPPEGGDWADLAVAAMTKEGEAG